MKKFTLLSMNADSLQERIFFNSAHALAKHSCAVLYDSLMIFPFLFRLLLDYNAYEMPILS